VTDELRNLSKFGARTVTVVNSTTVSFRVRFGKIDLTTANVSLWQWKYIFVVVVSSTDVIGSCGIKPTEGRS
jgi:hypothetical protein